MFENLKEYAQVKLKSLHNAVTLEEKMVTFCEGQINFYLGRTERAEQFIKAVSELIQSHCKKTPACSADYKYGALSYSLEIPRNTSCFGDSELLGYIDGNHFFLKSNVLFDEIKTLYAREAFRINVPRSVYYADLIQSKILIPSNRLLLRAEFNLGIEGESGKFVCVPSNILKINASEI